MTPHHTDRKSPFARLRWWFSAAAPTAHLPALNVSRLMKTGAVYRYRTRNAAKPVSAFRRAGDFVFGAIFALACVSAVVVIKSGVV